MRTDLSGADNLFTVLSLGSVALALLLIGLLILRSGFHLAAHVGQGSGRRAGLDGWKVSRIVVFMIGALVAAITAVVRPEGLGAQILIWAGLFGAICLPLLIAIWEIRVVDMEKPANQDGPRRLGLAGKNLLYILGLPGVMTVFTMAGVALNPDRVDSELGQVGRGTVEFLWNPPVVAGTASNFYPLPKPTPCSDWLRTDLAINLPFGAQRSVDHIASTAEFWLDSTLNPITFNAFDTSGCYLRRVDYNRENARMVAAVTAYNFILVFVISTIVYSVFKHKVRKGVAKATANRSDGE